MKDGYFPLNGQCYACEAPCSVCTFDIAARYAAAESALTTLYTAVLGQISNAALIAALPTAANVAASAATLEKKNLYFTVYLIINEIVTTLGFGDTNLGDAL